MKVLKEIQKFWERIFESSNDFNQQSGFSYYAFISYTEKDEKWAEWLQWNLEHYQIPTRVRNERHDLPARVKPVFWYKNDLAGAHLSGAINKELEQSKYMIVVCSPASAKKEWVNEEVRYFKDTLGRGENIIPFIVDGEINSDNPEQECLPLPIRNLPREKELRGIDVRVYGKNKSLVNIVSTLFNIRFDILWNRFKRERQRRFAIGSAIFALCAFILYGCWDYFLHTKYEYFVDLEDCNGVPTGIIRVSNKDAMQYYRLYRFEYRRRMLQRVVYVDSDGNPQNHNNTELADRPCIQQLSYINGELTSIDCKDATLKTLFIMHLSKDKLAADLKDEDENQAANFIFSSTSVDQGLSIIQNSAFLDKVLKSPSKIARYVYERDDDGYIKRKMFAKHNGENDLGMDANGISGFEYERDSLHRVIRIRFLDDHGEYNTNNKGVAGKKYQYDKNGYLTVAEYIDKDGKLKYNELHWAKAIDTYDSKGYCLEERIYGTDGKPCVGVFGYHRTCLTHNDNVETFSFYDIHNKPTYTLSYGGEPGGYSCMTIVRNKKGQIVEMQYKDSNGDLCYNHHNVAIRKIEYNNEGLISGVRNFGIDKKPCLNIDGYFYESASYNKQGCETEHAFYGVNGMPIHHRSGIHCLRMKYDDSGRRMIEAHAFNVENIPIFCSLFDGASWVKIAYDGSSRWVSELSFYNPENKPAETRAGAKVCCERDPNGQITSYKFYNADNVLSSNATHCAIAELEYNKGGKETERRFYDENKKPMLLSGLFRISRSYNKNGQLEKICCYDTLLHLRTCVDGWATLEYKYSNGALCENSFYGERDNDERIEINGVHKFIYEIDDCGQILSKSFFNKDLQPTVNSQLSAHKVVYLFDDNKRKIGEDYYDTKGKDPFVSIRYQLNQRGQTTEQTAYDANKKLIESPLNYGVARLQMKYDSQNQPTYICATNHEGNKMNSSSGYAEAFFSYERNTQEAVFLDPEQKPVNTKDLAKPCVYGLNYLTETGQRLFSKQVMLSIDNEYKTIRIAFCYDLREQKVLKAIQCEDGLIQIYDVTSNQTNSYLSDTSEYDEYVQIVDSIQQEAEIKYGKPKLYHYVSQIVKD